MKLVISILFGLILSQGCSIASKNQNILAINVEHINDKKSINLLHSNEEVDSFTNGLVKIFEERGFICTYKSQSFGLLPARGYTQNLGFMLKQNIHVRTSVKISKSFIKIEFKEIEEKLGNGIFTTSKQDKKVILSTSEIITQYINQNIHNRLGLKVHPTGVLPESLKIGNEKVK